MNCSLYVHIPFCTQKCDYCDFFSLPFSLQQNSCRPDRSFVNAVIKETGFYAQRYDVKKWKTIYIGGGTPGLLSPELLELLVNGVKKTVENQEFEEITVELNPDNVTVPLLKSAEKCGVTRISMGIQALDDEVLKTVNRKCSVQKIIQALNLLKTHWQGRLSVDFIAGLPGQTRKSFIEQFDVVSGYGVDHISLYSLTLEENTPLYKKIEAGQLEWNSDMSDELWLTGRDILEKYGFHQYEVSNFCKTGYESLHNQTYWKLESYIGCGPGASGTVYYENTLRWENKRNVTEYVDFWLKNAETEYFSEDSVNKIRHIENIDKKTEQFEYLMMGFRMRKGISSAEYEKRFGESLEKRIGVSGGVFEQWQMNKLAVTYRQNGDVFYALNADGLLLLNRFLESLL